MLTIRRNPLSWWNPVITTDWRWLIRLAWGGRSLSSGAAAAGCRAYPRHVGAGLGLWWRWYRRPRTIRTVVPEKPKPAYVWRPHEPHAAARRKPDLTQAQINILRAERAAARQRRDYQVSDAIRDFLAYHDVVESDSKMDQSEK